MPYIAITLLRRSPAASSNKRWSLGRVFIPVSQNTSILPLVTHFSFVQFNVTCQTPQSGGSKDRTNEIGDRSGDLCVLPLELSQARRSTGLKLHPLPVPHTDTL